MALAVRCGRSDADSDVEKSVTFKFRNDIRQLLLLPTCSSKWDMLMLTRQKHWIFAWMQPTMSWIFHPQTTRTKCEWDVRANYFIYKWRVIYQWFGTTNSATINQSVDPKLMLSHFNMVLLNRSHICRWELYWLWLPVPFHKSIRNLRKILNANELFSSLIRNIIVIP